MNPRPARGFVSYTISIIQIIFYLLGQTDIFTGDAIMFPFVNQPQKHGISIISIY